jgi:general secretion pathway protein F
MVQVARVYGMPTFRFKAYDRQGTLARGTLVVQSREDALDVIHRRGHFALEVTEERQAATVRWWEREVFGGGGLPLAGLSLLTRELATLIRADLPLDEALRIVSLQPLIPARIRRVTQAILDGVRQGDSLSGALAARGNEFPEYYWRLVRAGEASGSLAEVLEDMSAFLERSSEARGKIGSALLYPLVLLVGAGAAIAVIMTVLIPTVLPLFKDAGAEPPGILKFLVNAQDVIAHYWLLFILAIAAAAGGLVAAARNRAVRFSFHRALLRIPIIGGMIANRETARFSRTLATLTRNGVPMLEAVQISGSILSNMAFIEAVGIAREIVKEGGTLSAPLVESGLFSELSVRLIAVGEQTGQLETMLVRVATIYEAMLERQLSRLMSLLTPVLTLLIGGLVGGLILSVMSAILSVNDLALK